MNEHAAAEAAIVVSLISVVRFQPSHFVSIVKLGSSSTTRKMNIMRAIHHHHRNRITLQPGEFVLSVVSTQSTNQSITRSIRSHTPLTLYRLDARGRSPKSMLSSRR